MSWRGPRDEEGIVKGSLFVSYGCYNKIPQTGWLKTTNDYLDATNLKARCW